MGKVLAALLFSGSALLGVQGASALPVTYDFSGVINVTSVSVAAGSSSEAEAARLRGLLPGTLGGGNALFFRPLSGSFTVDSDAAVDSFPANPQIGNYGGFGFLSAFSVAIEGFDFAFDPARAGAAVTARVLDLPTVDAVDLTVLLGSDLLSGSASSLLTQLKFSFFSLDNLDSITSDRLPEDFASLGRFRVDIDFIDPLNRSSVGYGAIMDTLARRVSVPEGSSAVLFGCGLLGLLYHAGRSLQARKPLSKSSQGGRGAAQV